MSIYSSAVKKPITTLMIFAAVIIFGIYSLSRLPVDLYPEVEFPAISVVTIYAGANASDIETNISKPIEDACNSVENLKQINSISRDNMSIVTLEFEWETNLDEAANDIRNALEFVKDNLPDGAQTPIIYKFNSSMMPIIFYSISAKESYAGIEKLLDEKLVNRLNRIEGVGSVGLAGTPGRTVYIEVDPRKIEAYNLSVEMIGGILQAENFNLPAGNVEMGQMDYQLKVEGEFQSSDQIKDIVIGSFNGQTIYINDIATVKDTVKDMSLEERINGELGIRMFVMKQSGGNTIAVAREVKKELEEIKKTLPPDVEIKPIFDSSEFISQSVSNLSETLLYALIFVVLVVLFFLGRWRATFIVILTIPISLIVAFIYLSLSGSSINIISLASLSIAIGMVVDDAIVVLENITKHIERGATPREAALYATNEVWLAVIVTTLVVLAVFFPLTFVSGMTGVLFRQLGWIVSIVVTTSTIAAITLTPMLSSLMLRLRPAKKLPKFGYTNTIKRFLDSIDNGYEKVIRWSLRHKIIIMVGALAIFVLSFTLMPFIGTEFIPESDQSLVTAKIELQTGARVDETKMVARKIEDLVKERYPEVQLISSSAGSNDAGGVSAIWSSSGSHILNLQLRLVDIDQRNRSCWEIGDDFRKQLETIPEIIDFSLGFSGGMGGLGNQGIEVEIYGYDFEVTNRIASELAENIKMLDGARDITISRDKSKPELKVVLDREKLAQYGLNTASVSLAIRNRILGFTATKYRETGDEYDVVVRLKEEFRGSISDIENITIMNQQGVKVRLSELGHVVE
ncbi:MAG TPA: efflux RND transporter permease subunit, partial [Bacteroidales bacterium]|nr:efflux RND transporter permease subunit [Bacteroidales bacterium]